MPTYTIHITNHAVERFNERVRPALSPEAAGEELGRVALAGKVTKVPPPWHVNNCMELAPFYLEVADVLLPLRPHWTEPDVLVATTCIPRGSFSQDARRHRTARKQDAAATRRSRVR
ncbi:hypothetical protein DSM112329_04767 [Paraconexibacter sp. AEG42_29]|uniref:Uncharacterized protein n=1 Tax=Paraconexibacter sp. AEG42_29 TaxID=2997339 RepID=A0AAU7B1W9_9ACTN